MAAAWNLKILGELSVSLVTPTPCIHFPHHTYLSQRQPAIMPHVPNPQTPSLV
ncbi:hypothetical protein N658DRAFT_491995 [Parathielavia hyrcaniae]|uniref:Uncharacterized protein n=1 Tax=Parathielavia hyrcaniae TaxID=113614 RepID=A0AAN6Q8H4_9PEZI|nr:hypothetical protein N658DRAFT_491995 [Parathielavia hyrcaniae]